MAKKYALRNCWLYCPRPHQNQVKSELISLGHKNSGKVPIGEIRDLTTGVSV
jgi:hypothetical protein